MEREQQKVAVGTVLALRYTFGAFFLYGAYHKITQGWLSSPVMREHFVQRLSEIDPESFSAAYLRHFAIPYYRPVAWVLTIGQVIVAVSMLLGIAVRPSALIALFLLSNITAGSFTNATMPPFFVVSFLLLATPSGHWLGLDKHLHERYPELVWFK
ncbi:DoxX family membrane protein [Candidatus Viridilinea mediisalina]|uniref:DoxX family protein n=1 Tax=Candidatus Viridilinea mediisalina TaxID=2024553 RepID=A0A2A6RHW3_9CHLR|nr:DoxX family membrane protein [Candidatus Viridilinea mediisalina]PDW02458.1 DoxX family protein [Candidatus Viridilinea mediisalina]